MKKLLIHFLTAAVLLTSGLFGIDAGASTVSAGKTVLNAWESGHGTAGAFIGAIDGNTIIVAGGSDFPDARPWEGGKKTFLDNIWIIKKGTDGKWTGTVQEGVSLPTGIANGCCVTVGRTIYCFGGMTADGRYAQVLRIDFNNGKVSVKETGSLPEGFVPSAATAVKGGIYIHGTANGSNALYQLSPESMKWKELKGCPERPIAEGAVLASQHNGRESAIFLIGGRGTDAEGLHIASNIWEYIPVYDRWEKKAAFTSDGKPLRLMYSSAVNYGSAHIVVFGGDDGKEFIRRSNLEKQIAESEEDSVKDSLKAVLASAFTGHQGFCNKVFAYHTITDNWTEVAELDFTLPAVTAAVKSGKDIILVSGEAKPGVRSNEVVTVTLNDEVSFGWLNYTVVILYMLGMLGVGFYFSRKSSSTDQFFKGGGSIPWWAAGISIFATALSAITFLSIPAKAYAADWKMFMFNMTILMIVPFVIHFFLPMVRKLNVASIYQYLEERFSGSVRYLASAFFCLFMFARVAIVLFLPSLALNAVTGLNIYLCIVLMGVVTIIYCTMGGIEAVVWGDVIQGFLLVGGAILSLVWIISGIEGGFGTLMTVAIEEEKFRILDFSLDWTQPVFWVAIIGGFSNQLLTYTSDQSVVQRYLTVKDSSDAKKGLWLNGILAVPIAFLFFGIGTGLFVFFKQHPEILSLGMNNTDSIYPHYMMCELPAGVAGLLIAAVFAAAMSTLSSNINSSTTVMAEDFYAKIKPSCTDEDKLGFARISGIIVGGLGIVMALALATFDIASLWDQFNFFLGLLTSGLGGLFMMGIFTKRIGTRAAFTGFFGSIAVLLYCSAFTAINSTLYGFLGLISCFIIGYLSSFIFGYRK